MDLIQTLLRALAAVAAGCLIGSERERHGRAAGMRTHILVCLGACMTSMTSLFVAQTLGSSGDVFRIPAQVISGIGFLGAGVIVRKNERIITGLTTAAGVWTTATIGVALGYGYYTGAAAVTLLLLAAVVLLARLERRRKAVETVYVELEDAHRLNAVLHTLETQLSCGFSRQAVAPKSGAPGHIGLRLTFDRRSAVDPAALSGIEGIVFAIEEE